MAKHGDNYFEIFLSSDVVEAGNWQKLYQSIKQYSGLVPKFQIIVTFKDNHVRYFLKSGKDLSSLSNNLENMIIQSSDSKVEVPVHIGKQRFVSLKVGGNLLDLKEKYQIKKGIELEFFVCNIRAINHQKAVIRIYMYFKRAGGSHFRSSKLLTVFPASLLAADFSSGTKYMKKEVGRYLNIEKALNLLNSQPSSALFKVDSFPYFNTDYYINLTDYEFDKHSFIVGASGTGKSKLISLYVDRLANSALRDNYRVIVVDPHASLESDFEHLASKKIINFSQDGAELFSEGAQDIQAAVELTSVLFKSLLADQFNPRLDKALRFSLFVLLTAQSMSLDNLKRFLTELDLRSQMLAHVSGYVPENINRYFGGDFNEVRTQHYNEALQPIVSLIDELQLQPAIVGNNEVSIASLVKDNFLTVFSLNKVSMGERVTKTVAGLLIQQIFLMAQSRQFQQRVILIIDEVSIVQTPALAQILAEARKFNLTVILSQQYFGQIEKNLQDAIFANVFNYYTFKVSEEDARALEGNLNIELPQAILDVDLEKGLKEKDIRVKILTELNPRECLVRLSGNGQVYPCVKTRTMDANFVNQAGPREIRQDLEKVEVKQMPTKFVEGSFEDVKSIETIDMAVPVPVAEIEPVQEPVQAVSQPTKTLPSEPPMEREMINLSMLLAEQSSSRKIVNKRKASP